MWNYLSIVLQKERTRTRTKLSQSGSRACLLSHQGERKGQVPSIGPEKAHVPGSPQEGPTAQTCGSGTSAVFEMQIRSCQSSSQNFLMASHITKNKIYTSRPRPTNALLNLAFLSVFGPALHCRPIDPDFRLEHLEGVTYRLYPPSSHSVFRS